MEGGGTVVGALLAVLAFACSTATLACALMLLLGGRGWDAGAYAAGGLCLAVWAGARLVSAPT